VKSSSMQVFVLFATITGIILTYAAQFGFFAVDPGQVSDTFFEEVLIIPAGYAFSIWSLIYLGFGAFAVYQALPRNKNHPRLGKTRPWLAASLLLNPVWVLAFEGLYFIPSLIIITIMLVLALIMHRTLEIGTRTPKDNSERFLHIPFSLYAAWLTTATILEISGVLAVYTWNGFGLTDLTWAVIILLAVFALGLLFRLYLYDAVFGAVFVWAFVAIAVESDILLIEILAFVAAVAIAVSLPSPFAVKLREKLLPSS